MRVSALPTPFACLTIEKPNGKIQNSCKAAPDEIGDLQICRRSADLPKGLYHFDDKGNQQKQPEKGEQIPMQPEENHAPQEIDGKLCAIDG